jgi:outer membrane protein
VAVFVAAVFFGREARGQADTVSLEEAILAAQEKNLSVAVARTEARKSVLRGEELRSTRIPPFFFRSHYLYAPDRGYNEIVTNGGEYGVLLSTGLPLYDGGARGAAIDQAETEIDRSGIALQRARVELGFQARSLYYELVRSKGELRIRRESVGRLRDYTGLLVEMQKSGMAGESDVLKARVDLNNALIALESANAAVQKGEVQLNEVMGRPLDSALEVTPLPFPDTSRPSAPSVNDNLDLRLLLQEQASASFDLAIANAERLPTLAVVADAGALGVRPSEFRHDLGYSFLLTLDLPVFTWGGVSARIEQKELALESLGIQVDLERRDVETRLRLAQKDLALAVSALGRVARNRDDAERNYMLGKARFAGGAGSNLDVLDDHRLLVQAEIDYNNALFQYRVAEAALRRLNGQS